MSIQHFRTALGGFNRQDVVGYIEYMNNQHKAQIEQLNNQLKAAQEAAQQACDQDLKEKLEAAEARCAQLEAMVAGKADSELETYRRAERTERLANERAKQVCDQANGVIAEASVKVEEAAAHVDAVAGQLQAHLQAYMDSVSEAGTILSDAQSVLGSIHFEEE